VRSVLDIKTDNILSMVDRDEDHNLSTNELRDIYTSDWSKIGEPGEILCDIFSNAVPLKSICPVCFGNEPAPEFAAVCFDGCMQQKRLKGTMKEDRQYEYRNKLLFVSDETDDEPDEVLNPLFNSKLSNVSGVGQ
jgi:hypothetical protein